MVDHFAMVETWPRGSVVSQPCVEEDLNPGLRQCELIDTHYMGDGLI
jgi:hypothetical protein